MRASAASVLPGQAELRRFIFFNGGSPLGGPRRGGGRAPIGGARAEAGAAPHGRSGGSEDEGTHLHQVRAGQMTGATTRDDIGVSRGQKEGLAPRAVTAITQGGRHNESAWTPRASEQATALLALGGVVVWGSRPGTRN